MSKAKTGAAGKALQSLIASIQQAAQDAEEVRAEALAAGSFQAAITALAKRQACQERAARIEIMTLGANLISSQQLQVTAILAGGDASWVAANAALKAIGELEAEQARIEEARREREMESATPDDLLQILTGAISEMDPMDVARIRSICDGRLTPRAVEG
jgi:hypothetical protein